MKPTARDSRLKRNGASRKDRAMDDRSVTQDREVTDSERLDVLRSVNFQTALPDLPKIPGYHVCWLTTTNPRDPIHGRMRLGYEPIRGSEIPGFEHSTVKSGEWEGVIGVNEMLAFKIPLHLYEAFMHELHHAQPLAEEEKLREAARVAAENARAINRNARLEAEEGTDRLGEAPEPPPFSRAYGES